MHNHSVRLVRLASRRAERLIGRWRQDRSGVTAIEFAMVSLPFLVLVFAIMQIGLLYFTTFTLENATEQAARLIRTGQAQTTNLSEAQFKAKVCELAARFVDCGAKLRVDVRSFPSFSGIVPPSGVDESGKLRTSMNYSPGAAGDVVLVTVFYQWDLASKFPPFIIGGHQWGLKSGNMAGGARLLQAATAFRNEPFSN